MKARRREPETRLEAREAVKSPEALEPWRSTSTTVAALQTIRQAASGVKPFFTALEDLKSAAAHLVTRLPGPESCSSRPITRACYRLICPAVARV
jgi:hypothetical protein